MAEKKQDGRIRSYLREFSEGTTLHGVRYVGETNRHWSERLCWIGAMLSCAAVCGFQISNVWTRWYVSPVINSFAQRATRVSEIPFPAITICPVMQIPRDVFDMDTVLQLENNDELTFSILRQNLTKEEKLIGQTVSMLCDGVNVLEHFSPNEHHFEKMLQVSPGIQYFLSGCDNSLSVYTAETCAKHFRTISANSQVCHSYNLQSDEDLFIHPTYAMPILGNISKEDAMVVLSSDTVGPEASFGITLRIPDAQKQESCFHPYLRNKNMFQVFVHSPADFPLYGAILQPLTISPWSEIEIRLKPSITTTDASLRAYSPETRGCRFPDEQKMQIFKTYSKHHCEVECYMWKAKSLWCGCLEMDYYGNRTWQRCFSAIPIEKCEEILKNLEEQKSMCEYCLPSCDEIRYDRNIMSRSLDPGSVPVVKDKTGAFKPANLTGYTYARLNIYFEEKEFLGIQRSEVFGFTDVLSNCGGLLGLFTGFSVITMFEVLYFATLRLCCTLRHQPHKIAPKDIEGEEKTVAVTIPFKETY